MQVEPVQQNRAEVHRREMKETRVALNANANTAASGPLRAASNNAWPKLYIQQIFR